MAARQASAQYPLDMGLRWTCSDTSVAKCQAHTCLRKGVAACAHPRRRVAGAGADDLPTIGRIGSTRLERLNAGTTRAYLRLRSGPAEAKAAVLRDVGPATCETSRQKAR